MSYCNCGSGQSSQQAQQVNDNTKAIEQNTEDIANEKLRNDVQDGNIEDIEEEIEQINDALADGGVFASRRISTSSQIACTGVFVDISYDVVDAETNEPLVIEGDPVTNNHVLLRDGRYDLDAGFSITNPAGSYKNFTAELVIIDKVTLIEEVVDQRSIIVPPTVTLPINPNFQYEKPVGSNDKEVVVRQNGEVGVFILAGQSLGAKSQFTVGGSGIATKSKNIGPTDVSLEGVTESETTIAQILDNYKSLLIEKSGDNTVLKRNGTIKITIADGVTGINNQRLVDVANPTNAQDAVTKAFMETVIKDNAGVETQLLVNGVIEWFIASNGDLRGASGKSNNIDLRNEGRIIELLDPTNPQDAVTKAFLDNLIRNDGAGNVSIRDANGVTRFNLDTNGDLNSTAPKQIKNIANPTLLQDVATKNYVDGGEQAMSDIGLQSTLNFGKSINFAKHMVIDCAFTADSNITASAGSPYSACRLVGDAPANTVRMAGVDGNGVFVPISIDTSGFIKILASITSGTQVFVNGVVTV